MKIAQIAPLTESVPPKKYGGTERVVANLTEELVRRGHDLTLFASGDSRTSAKLVAGSQRAMRHGSQTEHQVRDLLMLERALSSKPAFDIYHFHTGFLHFPAARGRSIAHVTTMHGPVDIPEAAVYREYREAGLISISYSQRQPAPDLNWVGNVYHGYPKSLYRFVPEAGDDLVFLGRISPEKRVDRAIEIAIQAERRLLIGAKVDPVDEEYFQSSIRPLLSHPLIEYVGEVDDGQKQELLGNAAAMVFPIDWREPFGLVMIEALACGTPVIAFRRGSVPEVIRHGVTGFVVGDIAEAVVAVNRITEIRREECRRDFEERFSVEKMADRYLKIYEEMVSRPKGVATIASVA